MENMPTDHTEISFPNILDTMRQTLATVFGMYLIAHGYHWNVTGPTFAQDHAFFGDLYSELWESVDDYAEHIRILGSFAPGSLERMTQLSSAASITGIPTTPNGMYSNLLYANKTVLSKLYDAVGIADSLNKRGLTNFLEERIMYHEKLGWKLESFKPAQ